MNTNNRLAVAVLSAFVALATFSSPAAQVGDGPVSARAEIRIGLPSGVTPRVEVEPEGDRVLLDLPQGAEFPDNFARSSGGMLRDANVVRDGDRVRLEIDLARGLLERIVYEPGAVVLSFASRLSALDSESDPEDQYTIGPSDRLLLTVHNQEKLTTELTVTGDGVITAPLVGDVRAAGLSPRLLANRVAEHLGRDFLVDPQVDVDIIEYNSQWVVVSGQVKKPGRVALEGGTRLKEVLGQAEGFNEFAGQSIVITRTIPGTGETKTLRVDRFDFERGKVNPSLSHEDSVEVELAERCYVQGEVRDAGWTAVQRETTLLRAIADANGLTEWADRKNVIVLNPSGKQPRKRVFNLNKIENGKIDDPRMVGGEMIIVKRRFL